MEKMGAQYIFRPRWVLALLLLFLTVMAVAAARPLHADSSVGQWEYSSTSRDGGAEQQSTPGSEEPREEKVGEETPGEESCEDIDEEECIIRRTLAAHTDYIYTQHNHP